MKYIMNFTNATNLQMMQMGGIRGSMMPNKNTESNFSSQHRIPLSSESDIMLHTM